MKYDVLTVVFLTISVIAQSISLILGYFCKNEELIYEYEVKRLNFKHSNAANYTEAQFLEKSANLNWELFFVLQESDGNKTFYFKRIKH